MKIGGRQLGRALGAALNREGIAIAKTVPGKYKGRIPALKPSQVQELKALAQTGSIKKVDLAKRFGISRASLYNYLAEA